MKTGNKMLLSKFDIYAIAAGTIGLGYLGYRYFKNRQERKEKRQQTTDIKEAEKAGQKLSYTLSSYTQMADQIFGAWASNVTLNLWNQTNGPLIIGIFRKMNNDLDVIQLIKAFGKRRQPTPFLSYATENVELGQWLSIALDDDELDAINKHFAGKGIRFRF
jgi:hypothetical protein